MKVIKKGSDRVLKVTCGSCLTLFEFSGDDIVGTDEVKGKYTGNDGLYNYYDKITISYVRCPECDHRVGMENIEKFFDKMTNKKEKLKCKEN